MLYVLCIGFQWCALPCSGSRFLGWRFVRHRQLLLIVSGTSIQIVPDSIIRGFSLIPLDYLDYYYYLDNCYPGHWTILNVFIHINFNRLHPCFIEKCIVCEGPLYLFFWLSRVKRYLKIAQTLSPGCPFRAHCSHWIDV